MLKFTNNNAEPFYRWILRRSDPLDHFVFYFLSRTNATSPRYFSLFNSSTRIRIVYLSGLRVPYTDLVLLKFYKLLIYLFKLKISNYKFVHIISDTTYLKSKNQVMHIDDPTYNLKEQKNLIKWNRYLLSNGLNPFIVCTNSFTAKWLDSFMEKTKVTIIEQGFFTTEDIAVNSQQKVDKVFSCVYSSPYIHIGKDKHAKHDTWGAELLINEIIPAIAQKDLKIQIHLIGEVGNDASKALMNHNNIIYHGRVDFFQNTRILSDCSVGIYPRNVDLKRSMSKIFSYIGAGLPIVTYDLYDTEVVKLNNLGYSVSSIDEFVDKIIFLKNNPDELKKLSSNVNAFKNAYTWENLSKKMEDYLINF